MNKSVFCRAIGAAGAVTLCSAGSVRAALPPYSSVGSFALPSPTYDIMPDGRVAYLDGADIYIQDSPNGSTYTRAGGVEPSLISPFGASVLAVSPDGSRMAIGDGNFGSGAAVLIVDTVSLDPSAPSSAAAVGAANFDAQWTGDNTLFVTGYDTTAQVTRIDASALTSRVVVTNIGSGSGGVTTDGTWLYTADGFDTSMGGAPTGEIRAFALSDIAAAAAPIDFSTGIPVADALSGVPLGFDNLGNLLVGGGDFYSGSNDFGYAAVVDGAAIDAALAGGSIAPDASELHLSPAGADVPYGIGYNRATGELLVVADSTAYRYAVPAPAAAAPLTMLGVAATRRRRRA